MGKINSRDFEIADALCDEFFDRLDAGAVHVDDVRLIAAEAIARYREELERKRVPYAVRPRVLDFPAARRNR